MPNHRLQLTALIVFACATAVGCKQVNTQALNSEGVRLYQSGNYVQAADQFQKAIATDPNSATSYYNLAAALHKDGKQHNRADELAQAERYYNQCLEYDPNQTECYRGLGVLLAESGRQDAAFRLLEGWAGRSPKLADPRIELARLLEETNNKPQATTRLVEALAIDPQNSRALTALGRLREESGDYAQALADYQRSLTVNRFQPEVTTRVASLQAAGVSATAPPIVTPQGDTRTADRWQPVVRY